MKSRIFGVLTIVAFIVTSSAYISFGQSDTEPENTAVLSSDSFSAESDKAKATSMRVVGKKGCGPCYKIKKEVLPGLVKEGYDVKYVDHKDWKGPGISVVPTLFYFDGSEVVKVQVGYKTAKEIKRYLKK